MKEVVNAELKRIEWQKSFFEYIECVSSFCDLAAFKKERQNIIGYPIYWDSDSIKLFSNEKDLRNLYHRLLKTIFSKDYPTLDVIEKVSNEEEVLFQLKCVLKKPSKEEFESLNTLYDLCINNDKYVLILKRENGFYRIDKYENKNKTISFKQFMYLIAYCGLDKKAVMVTGSSNRLIISDSIGYIKLCKRTIKPLKVKIRSNNRYES